MRASETKWRQDLKFASYIVLAIVLEAVIILWPLACTLSGKGYMELWDVRVAVPERLPNGEVDEEAMDEWMEGQLVWLIVSRIKGRLRLILSVLVLWLPFELFAGFVGFLARRFSVNFRGLFLFALIQWIITGIDIRLSKMILPMLAMKGSTLLFFIYSGFGTGLFLGILLGLFVERFFLGGLSGKLLAGLCMGVLATLSSVAITFEPNLVMVMQKFIFASAILLGVLLAALIKYGLEQIFAGHISTIKGFCEPWRLGNYSFWKAIAFFGLLYIAFVLVFSMWFYACYLEGSAENPFFNIGKIVEPSWWDFFYFSFVTILTLGYGDISPLHPFPQALVILETIIGVGMIAGYLSIILQVAGQKRQAIDATTREDDE